jgi:hypothetical protein
MLRFLLLLSTVSAWVMPYTRVASPQTRLTMSSEVRSVSLEDLEDHDEEGARMAKSITAWLDAEWMPQEVHVQMAESAKKSYISCRQEGDNEIMSIMMQIANDLDKDWMEKYDADAFVNAWDVSNYVSDYLTHRTGSETCECSNKIY